MFFLLFFYHHIYIIHKYHITCRTQTPANGFFLHFYPFLGNLFKNMIFFFNTRCSSRSLWIAGCPCQSGNLNGIVLILITFFSWFSTSSMLNCVSLFLLHWEYIGKFVDVFWMNLLIFLVCRFVVGSGKRGKYLFTSEILWKDISFPCDFSKDLFRISTSRKIC